MRVRWTPALRARVIELVDTGHSPAQIAGMLAVTPDELDGMRRRHGIGSVYDWTLSAGGVARVMGVDTTTAIAWLTEDWLTGTRIRRQGPYRGWMVRWPDLYAFVADERTWHLWEVERIEDAPLRHHARQVRGDVAFLGVRAVARRLDVSEYTVRRWIRTGRLPARRRGNWLVDSRDLPPDAATLMPPRRPMAVPRRPSGIGRTGPYHPWRAPLKRQGDAA